MLRNISLRSYRAEDVGQRRARDYFFALSSLAVLTERVCASARRIPIWNVSPSSARRMSGRARFTAPLVVPTNYSPSSARRDPRTSTRSSPNRTRRRRRRTPTRRRRRIKRIKSLKIFGVEAHEGHVTRRTTFRFNVTENREPRTESSRVVPSSSSSSTIIVRAAPMACFPSRDPRSRERDCADDDRRRGIRVDVSPRARVHRTLPATLRAVDRVNCRVSIAASDASCESSPESSS